jgi:hypothetical protein
MLRELWRNGGRKLHQGKPEALVKAAWGLAQLGIREASHYEALARAALPKLQDFTMRVRNSDQRPCGASYQSLCNLWHSATATQSSSV